MDSKYSNIQTAEDYTSLTALIAKTDLQTAAGDGQFTYVQMGGFPHGVVERVTGHHGVDVRTMFTLEYEAKQVREFVTVEFENLPLFVHSRLKTASELSYPVIVRGYLHPRSTPECITLRGDQIKMGGLTYSRRGLEKMADESLPAR